MPIIRTIINTSARQIGETRCCLLFADLRGMPPSLLVTSTGYGHPSAYLRSNTQIVEGFGTLMQDFRADHYLGKRVRFNAFVRTQEAQDWAGLWMRVDKGPKQIAFANMQGRPIKGTTDWKRYDVVLDVPQEATGIFFGVLLSGPGTVWLNGANFEVVGLNIPTTGVDGVQKSDEPMNLNFEN